MENCWFKQYKVNPKYPHQNREPQSQAPPFQIVYFRNQTQSSLPNPQSKYTRAQYLHHQQTPHKNQYSNLFKFMLTFFLFLSSFFSNTTVVISHVDADYIFNLLLYVQFIAITTFISFSRIFVLSNTLILFFLLLCLLEQVVGVRLFHATFYKNCIIIFVAFIRRFFACFLWFFVVVFALYIFWNLVSSNICNLKYDTSLITL